MRLTRRIHRASVPSALIITLPGVLLVAWYAWSAFAELDRYRRSIKADVAIDSELFHIALHDTLQRDLRRLAFKEPTERAPLPVYELSVTRAQLEVLDEQSYAEGLDHYVKGLLRKSGETHKVLVRYHGGEHWERLPQQKSFKIRVKRGDLLDGVRVFNLVNSVKPFDMERQIVLDVAREVGLLTPEHHSVWLRLNNADLGVYHYTAQPNEGLLRRSQRMPGSIFSGKSSHAGPDGVGALFFGTDGWKQVARRTGRVIHHEQSFDELERLIAAIKHASHAEFAEFARRELSLDDFALYDAIDVVFGAGKHGYAGNHKLYFDAYRGRFEPIAWNFGDLRHREVFNLVENPLLIRLKFVPGYLARRDREIYRLLLGEASISAIRARLDSTLARMKSAFDADPYWDAYDLLPGVTDFHRNMVRPMTRERWQLSAETKMHEFAVRSRYLRRRLEAQSFSLKATGTSARQVTLDVTVRDHGAYTLTALRFTGGGCRGVFRVRADADLDGQRSDADVAVASGALGSSAEITSFIDLEPGVRLVARDPVTKRGGAVATTRVARTYRYFVDSDECPLAETEVFLKNTVTGVAYRLSLAVDTTHDVADLRQAAEVSDAPQLRPGDESAPLWSFDVAPEARDIVLGPGRIDLGETRVFGAHEQVRILSGTTLRLAQGASLIFLGPLQVEGRSDAPVKVIPLDPKTPYGGIALQGQHTAGSRLRHMEIWGGTRPEYLAIDYPGLLNIHDTSDIRVEFVELRSQQSGLDVLRATYVKDLTLHEIDVASAPSDAIDLEFVSGTLRGARVASAGDECLDLMSSKLRLLDSALVGCKGNAISAGEETEVNLHGLLIADSRVGILAKNASHVSITKSLIYRTGTGLRTKRRDVHYSGKSFIGAHDLYVVRCKNAISRAHGTRLDVGNIRFALPRGSHAGHPLSAALHVDDWDELDGMIARLGGK